MVVGIDKFREHFAGHENEYTLIGGSACDLLFDDAGLPFRVTKDLDIVLCVEVVSEDFGKALATFIEAGGYEAREKGGEDKEYFRFHKPGDQSYPYMLEIFSRKPDGISLPEGMGIARVQVEEDVLSLSAILLDDNYYDALQNSKVILDGISILEESLLIPFKAKAYVDIRERQAKGEKVKQDDIKKHRNDVFRLLQLLPGNARIEVSEPIQNDLRTFIEDIRDNEKLDPNSFGVRMSRADGIEQLEKAYELK